MAGKCWARFCAWLDAPSGFDKIERLLQLGMMVGLALMMVVWLVVVFVWLAVTTCEAFGWLAWGGP